MLHYVVSLYTGVRQNMLVNNILKENPCHYLDLHIQRLKLYGSKDISKITFVINPSDDRERDEFVCQKANGIDVGFCITESYIREDNKYYSYGGWEDCIRKNISNLDFFLIEDDYFPASKGFYEPFHQRIKANSNVAYVCQLYKNKHAAISNGCLSRKAAEKHIETYGESLFLRKFDAIVYPPDSVTERERAYYLYERQNEAVEVRRPLMKQRPQTKPRIPNMPKVGTKVIHPGVFAQEKFLQGYDALGYGFEDLSEQYYHPFLQSGKDVKDYGNRKGTLLLECEFFEK